MTPASRDPLRRIAAWMAFGWATAFACVHGYWAFGGRLGLPSDIVLHDNIPLLVVDLVAIPLCLAAAAIAWALAQRSAPRRFDRAATAAAAIALFCFVHAIPPLLDFAVQCLANGSPPRLTERDAYALLLYEPYWLIGGLAFGSAWLTMPRPERRGRPS